ncbi:T6SS effector BTH_I2691 family protein [Celerinatantimonas sp. MCCC 1A17872]|uniref:T6SS effector BTH_I2691 family protein n=1 Tax=Celerinatantimonas sp. MCCC 1A17872 TaxID=3177514 RepID=UPI0038BF81A7
MSTTSDSPARAAAKAGGQSDVKSASKQCKLKSGTIAIVPVRYALDDVDESTGKQNNPLPSNEPWHPPFKVHHSFYTLRQLRDGWLYVYSEQNKTLHEYQVSGADLIKYDWGTNAPDQTPDERGTPGVSATYIEHSVKETLYLAFAHQRWTWRICEHMRSDVTARNQWMRRLSLGHYHATMEHQHTADISLLGERVADISSSSQSVPLDAFSGTCTPLSPLYMPDDSSTNQADSDKSNLVAVKAPNSEATYTAGLDKQSALFVALDDVLADTSDSFLQLNHHWINRRAVIGDDENQKKLQTAEIIRSLGRARVPVKELPPQVKNDIESQLDFENTLTAYLSALHTRQANLKGSQGLAIMTASQASQSQIQNIRSQLKKRWNYEVPDPLSLTSTKSCDDFLKKYGHIYDCETIVQWEKLDKFLIQIGNEIQQINQKIELFFEEFTSIVEQLGVETERFGIDTQTEDGQHYLYNLFFQILACVTQATVTSDLEKRLKEILSIKHPKNLLALSGFSFSYSLWDQLNKATVQNNYFNVSPSNIDVIIGRMSTWHALTTTKKIIESKFYKEFLQPIQETVDAFCKLGSTSNIKKMMNKVTDMVLPYQWINKNTPEALLGNLRFVFVKSILYDAPIVVDPEAVKKYNSVSSSIESLKLNLKEYVHNTMVKKGKVINPDKVKRQQAKIDTLKYQKELLESSLIKTTNEKIMNEVKVKTQDYFNQKIDSWGERTKNIWDKAGKYDGISAVLTMWNLMAEIANIQGELGKDKSPYHVEVIKKISSDFAWSVSAIFQLYKNQAWTELKSIDSDLIELSITKLEVTIGKESLEFLTVTEILALTRVVAIATGLACLLDSLTLLKKTMNKLESPLARLGYSFQFISTLGIGAVSVGQFMATIMINSPIAAMAAAWMTVVGAIASVLLVLGLIMVCLFSYSSIQKWLEQTTWGIHPNKNWSLSDALKKFISLIYEPIVQTEKLPLSKEEAIKLSQSGKSPDEIILFHKWRITISLNTQLVEGATIGLKIIYQSASGQSKVIDESKGQWQALKNDEKSSNIRQYIVEFMGHSRMGCNIGICFGIIYNLGYDKEGVYYFGKLEAGVAEATSTVHMKQTKNLEASVHQAHLDEELYAFKPLNMQFTQIKMADVDKNIPMRSIGKPTL